MRNISHSSPSIFFQPPVGISAVSVKIKKGSSVVYIFTKKAVHHILWLCVVDEGRTHTPWSWMGAINRDFKGRGFPFSWCLHGCLRTLATLQSFISIDCLLFPEKKKYKKSTSRTKYIYSHHARLPRSLIIYVKSRKIDLLHNLTTKNCLQFVSHCIFQSFKRMPKFATKKL